MRMNMRRANHFSLATHNGARRRSVRSVWSQTRWPDFRAQDRDKWEWRKGGELLGLFGTQLTAITRLEKPSARSWPSLTSRGRLLDCMKNNWESISRWLLLRMRTS